MKSPQNLRHKPIISVNDYDKSDIVFFKGSTDAKALSIGTAQYNKEDLSLKVWRHTGKNWSRQSEELPIHRNLDLSILFLSALLKKKGIQNASEDSTEKLTVNQPSKVKCIEEYYKKNKQHLDPRLRKLKQLLNEIIK